MRVQFKKIGETLTRSDKAVVYLVLKMSWNVHW